VLSEDVEGIVDADPELDCSLLVKGLSVIRAQDTYSWWHNCK
jgi:hypothetical protein